MFWFLVHTYLLLLFPKRLSQRAVTWGQCSPHHNLLGKNVSIFQFVHLTVKKPPKTTSSEYEYFANLQIIFLYFSISITIFRCDSPKWA